MMTYEEAQDFLYNGLRNYQRTGSVAQDDNSPLGGGRTSLPTRAKILRLLYGLGNPHRSEKCKYIHVAGTNGKGTVSTLLAAMFTAAGYKTGLSTSPHYVELGERIRIDGRLMPKADLAAWVTQNQALMLRLEVSFFEAIQALAFDYFSTQQVEVAIIEVGLGGTWDASNVIAPQVSVITNIGLDHVAELGHTLDRIAAEKAGIIQAQTPVVIGRRQELPHEVFASLCAGLGAPMYYAGQLVSVSIDGSQSRREVIAKLSSASASREDRSHSSAAKISEATSISFETDLQGPFAHENLTTAIATFQVFMASQIAAERQVLAKAVKGIADLAAYNYRGRMQRIKDQPEVIVDAAHNADAWRPVLKNIDQLAPAHRWLGVICGFKAGKEAMVFFENLPQHAHIIITQSSVLGEQPAVVARHLSDSSFSFANQVETVANVGVALKKLLAIAPVDGLIFVGGSSYLVGDALSWFAHKT